MLIVFMVEFCSIKQTNQFNSSIEVSFFSDKNSNERILEISAVGMNLAFTVLYLNQSIWAFFFGIMGPAALLILGVRRKLYADPVLQVVYMLSAVVGFWNIAQGWSPVVLAPSSHIWILVACAAVSLIWGYLLRTHTQAASPYLDALISVLGIVATWLMMFQVQACWSYLLVVNALSIFLFLKRRLFLTALMFALYFVMSIDGFFELHWFDL
jgi:nicotinamide mononucleotide transporter